MRHPLYLSYVIAAIGFNLQVWNLATLLLVLLGWVAMVYRIVVEERVFLKTRRGHCMSRRFVTAFSPASGDASLFQHDGGFCTRA